MSAQHRGHSIQAPDDHRQREETEQPAAIVEAADALQRLPQNVCHGIAQAVRDRHALEQPEPQRLESRD